MKKLSLTAIMIFTLIGSLVAGLQAVEVAEANPILTKLPHIVIRSDGSIDGSLYPLPISKTDNAYTLTANIEGYSLDILCNNVTVDGANFSLKGTQMYNDNSAITIVANGVIVKNFNISHYDWSAINITGSYNIVFGICASEVLNFGVFIEGTHNNISRNILSSPNYALWLTSLSSNNTITENILHTSIGGDGKNNLFYLNNFDNSIVLLGSTANPSMNFFDNGSIGNYWSNYNGTDANGDGIGDEPYIIDANDKDNYPLMLPITFTVDTYPTPQSTTTPSLSPTPSPTESPSESPTRTPTLEPTLEPSPTASSTQPPHSRVDEDFIYIAILIVVGLVALAVMVGIAVILRKKQKD